MMDLVWFRGKDLRLTDHPPLSLANSDSAYLFVVDPYFFAPHRAQAIPHRIQYLLDALNCLSSSIASKGGTLWVVEGPCLDVVPALAHRIGASRVIAQAWSDPLGRRRDERIQAKLNIPLILTSGETLHPPGTLRTLAGKPYTVFTPFSKSFRKKIDIDTPLAPPEGLSSSIPYPADLDWPCREIPSLGELGLERNPDLIPAGEFSAHQRLCCFLEGAGKDYDQGRDRMDQAGTSRLSADLKFGAISPRSVWTAIMNSDLPPLQKFKFTNELIWREFNYSALFDNPSLLKTPFKSKWMNFPWENNKQRWTAWKTGQTGYPIIDAAARELLETGHVHNRARMITASFLTKHLLIDYKWGESHFLKWLTDGDWAQNNMGWQWAAGCGADANPWFRIFNPMTQGRKFDSSGAYVRKWVPELAKLDNRYIHSPWEAPALALRLANVNLGQNYPHPIVDHKTARAKFLSVAKAYFDKINTP